MKIAKSLTELIGNTPMLELVKYSKANGIETPLIAKLEYFNPAGSAKDRAAMFMIEDAEKKGVLKPGSTIIEATSGNTGVGLAFVAAVKGYKLIVCLPDTMSKERISLLQAYGAEVILTPGAEGMKGSIDKQNELLKATPNSISMGQFDNPANPQSHYETTAEEIWRDTDGKVDAVVAGVGTGGTICGIGRKLKEKNPNIKIIAVEPATSPVLSGGKAGPHKLMGLGANFVPKNFEAKYVDEVMQAGNDESILTSRNLTQQEGLLVGISSGTAVLAAKEYALRPENKGKKIVVILPDTGERYLSTVLYAFDEYPL